MSQPIVPLTLPKSRRFEKKSRNDILMKIRLEKVELTFFHGFAALGNLFCQAPAIRHHTPTHQNE